MELNEKERNTANVVYDAIGNIYDKQLEKLWFLYNQSQGTAIQEFIWQMIQEMNEEKEYAANDVASRVVEILTTK